MPAVDSSFFSLLLLLISSFVGYGVLLAAYRLLLHPLSRFPGPKLAAATYWKSFYDDVLQGQHPGCELYHIHQLHDQYGTYSQNSTISIALRCQDPSSE